jgi:citrate lyase subunit beta/citryl-CoA lyase
MTTRHICSGWRSLLYVPANVQRFIEKAPLSGADAIILDLEDSLPLADKEASRQNLVSAVATCASAGAAVFVRINRPLDQAVRDLEAAIAAGARTILVPKAHGPEHIRLLAELSDSLDRNGDAEPGISFIPLIETADAVARMHEIASSAPNVVGIIIGTEDLATEFACDPDGELMTTVKYQMVMAAAAAGIAAIGLLGSVANFKDLPKLRELALRSRRSGFSGATCVHPSVVPVLNEAFGPSDQEIELATRQLAAADQARSVGRGSVVVDGRMVDSPILRRAQRIMSMARPKV